MEIALTNPTASNNSLARFSISFVETVDVHEMSCSMLSTTSWTHSATALWTKNCLPIRNFFRDYEVIILDIFVLALPGEKRHMILV
jgi:hypothetical protein